MLNLTTPPGLRILGRGGLRLAPGTGELPAPLALITFTTEGDVASFLSSVAGAYTGTGDSVALNREKAAGSGVSEVRTTYVGSGNSTGPCVLLEDDPTPCVLVAPANVMGEDNGDGTCDLAWTAVPVTGSLNRYDYRLVGADGPGEWATTVFAGQNNVSAGAGTYVVEVRAVSTSGVAGASGLSAVFTMVEDGEQTYTEIQTQGDTSDYNHLGNGARRELASSIVAVASAPLTRIIVKGLRRVGSPTYDLSFLLYDDDDGRPGTLLATSSTIINAGDLGTSFGNLPCDFEDTDSEDGSKYWVAALASADGDGDNYVDWAGNPAGTGTQIGRVAGAGTSGGGLDWVIASNNFDGGLTLLTSP